MVIPKGWETQSLLMRNVHGGIVDYDGPAGDKNDHQLGVSMIQFCTGIQKQCRQVKHRDRH